MKYNKKRQNIARKKRRVGAASAHPGRVRPHDPASGQSDAPAWNDLVFCARGRVPAFGGDAGSQRLHIAANGPKGASPTANGLSQ